MKIYTKGKERYKKILEVALDLFMKKGYEKTSLSDIVSLSGGSLSTIYKYFGDKAGLFGTIIEHRIENFCETLEQNQNLSKAEKIDDFLYKFGIMYIEIFTNPQSIALMRLVISECYKKNKIGKFFSDTMLTKIDKVIIDFIKKQNEKGLLKEYDLETLAIQFSTLIAEPYKTRALITGKIPNLSKHAKDKIVSQAVDIFLYGVLKK